MKKKIQIFVSSTYTDLIEERQAAVSAILKAGHIPAGMELFTAGDESQMETIKRWIDESDVFMLILGGRYGSVEPTTSLSYMELEYDYAVKSGKPYFAVVIEESALEQKVREHGTAVIETVYTRELEAFRKKVLSRISAFFKDVQDIKLAVFETIPDLIARHDFKGWVSGSEIPDIQSYIDQINRLREANKHLTEDREALHSGEVFTPSEQREFQYLLNRLDHPINLTYSLYRQRPGEKSPVKIGEEIYKVQALSALNEVVKRGSHLFDLDYFAYYLHEQLNQQYPKMDETITRDDYGTTEERIDLELQKYGLVQHAYRQIFDRREATFELTEKMHRFAYWLDYTGRIPETHFELVSKTEVEVPPPSPPEENIPSLTTIKEIDRTLNFKARRNSWRTSVEGVTSARQEFERLYSELEHAVNVSNAESKAFRVSLTIEGPNRCLLSGMGISLDIVWTCGHPDNLEGSVLSVKGEKTKFDVEGVQSFTAQGNYYTSDFDIDINRDLKLVWIERPSHQPLTTKELAHSFMTTLIKAISVRVSRDG